MRIGVPTEIKIEEYRVGLTPESVFELTKNGHEVFIQKGAGQGIGASDQAYKKYGAIVLDTAEDIYRTTEMIIKVKEPQPIEFPLIQSHHILFTYLHLAAEKKLFAALQQSKCIAIAYETVTSSEGRLPLLAPMSEVAGRLSIQMGAHHLTKSKGGSGVLLGGVPGVHPGRVTILGGGVAGLNAAQMAIGMGARVTIIDKSVERLRELDLIFNAKIKTIYSTTVAIEENVAQSDLVIGAVLVPGASAPKLVTEAMIKKMSVGSVVVDIAIDQGGCFETSIPTTHKDPVYKVHDVTHYCVTNMPGAAAKTSTLSLNHSTLPFILKIANLGVERALKEDMHLLNGLNLYGGRITNSTIAQEFNAEYTPYGSQ